MTSDLEGCGTIDAGTGFDFKELIDFLNVETFPASGELKNLQCHNQVDEVQPSGEIFAVIDATIYSGDDCEGSGQNAQMKVYFDQPINECTEIKGKLSGLLSVLMNEFPELLN